MGERIEFFAAGLPKPQGSKRGFVVKGRAVIAEGGGQAHKDWRAVVAHEAHAAMAGQAPLTGPVAVRVVFCLPRPKGHPKGRVTWPATRPDADKLLRAVLDSLSRIVFADDGQVVDVAARKVWASVDTSDPPGARVQVWPVVAAPVARGQNALPLTALS